MLVLAHFFLDNTTAIKGYDGLRKGQNYNYHGNQKAGNCNAEQARLQKCATQVGHAFEGGLCVVDFYLASICCGGLLRLDVLVLCQNNLLQLVACKFLVDGSYVRVVQGFVARVHKLVLVEGDFGGKVGVSAQIGNHLAGGKLDDAVGIGVGIHRVVGYDDNKAILRQLFQ